MNTEKFQKLISSGGYIRAVNYHNTPRHRLEEYKNDFKFFSQHFSCVTEKDLEMFFNTGIWHKKKPGLIISLFNGYRNNFDVFKPLLDEYGFCGWFFIATQFVNEGIYNQKTFANNHTLSIIEREYDDGRYALNWNEVKKLDLNHVIASHTRNHIHVTPNSSNNELFNEIVGSQNDFSKYLGHRVKAFTWLYGGIDCDNEKVNEYIQEANYMFLFGNLGIQKVR